MFIYKYLYLIKFSKIEKFYKFLKIAFLHNLLRTLTFYDDPCFSFSCLTYLY